MQFNRYATITHLDTTLQSQLSGRMARMFVWARGGRRSSREGQDESCINWTRSRVAPTGLISLLLKQTPLVLTLLSSWTDSNHFLVIRHSSISPRLPFMHDTVALIKLCCSHWIMFIIQFYYCRVARILAASMITARLTRLSGGVCDLTLWPRITACALVPMFLPWIVDCSTFATWTIMILFDYDPSFWKVSCRCWSAAIDLQVAFLFRWWVADIGDIQDIQLFTVVMVR